MSSAETWGWTRSWLAQHYDPGVPIVAYTTTSTDPLDSQVQELGRQVTAGGWMGGYVFVGHSQGGLISRDLYQRFAANIFNTGARAPTTGVVTIGTPNLGAPVAPYARTLATNVLGAVSALRAQYCQTAAGLVFAPGACYTVTRLGTFAERPLQTLASSRALVDLTPNSGYLTHLRSAPEPFLRANIASYADKRWVEWRLAAESEPTCAPSDLTCNGQGLVNQVADAYAKLQACQTNAVFRFTNVASTCSRVAEALNSIDNTWDQLTAAGDPTTDGVVPGRSQIASGSIAFTQVTYPIKQYYISHGPSHVGETSNRTVYLQLQQVLDSEFRVGQPYP